MKGLTITRKYLECYDEARNEVNAVRPDWNHLHAQSAIAMIALLKYNNRVAKAVAKAAGEEAAR